MEETEVLAKQTMEEERKIMDRFGRVSHWYKWV